VGSSRRDNETSESVELEQEVDLLILADLMTALPGNPHKSRFDGGGGGGKSFLKLLPIMFWTP